MSLPNVDIPTTVLSTPSCLCVSVRPTLAQSRISRHPIAVSEGVVVVSLHPLGNSMVLRVIHRTQDESSSRLSGVLDDMIAC
jgi:hypothetical protein